MMWIDFKRTIIILFGSLFLLFCNPLHAGIEFDGDDYGDHVDHDDLSPGLGAWGIMFWYYAAMDSAANSPQYLWHQYEDANNRISVFIYPYRTDANNFGITFLTEDGGTEDKIAYADAQGSRKDIRGEWHHWAFIRTQASNSDGLYAYFDETLIGIDAARQVINCNPAAIVEVGYTGTGGWAKGVLDEMIMVKGKELTINDIKTHMAKRHTSNTYTMLDYPFDGDRNIAPSVFLGIANDFNWRSAFKSTIEAPILQERE